MNWVDLVVIGVVAFSGLLAFMRGLVREVLGIGAWIGAAFFAIWAYPSAYSKMQHWFPNPDIASPAAFAACFLLALIVLSVVAGIIGSVVRGSLLGGLDRTLGMVFGLLRGVALVIFAYIAAGMVVATDRWPEPVLQARCLPYAFAGAEWVADQLPPGYRPSVHPPPAGRETKAADLLHATPQGRAIGPP